MKLHYAGILTSLSFVMINGSEPKARAALKKTQETAKQEENPLKSSNPMDIPARKKNEPEECVAFSPPIYIEDLQKESAGQGVSPYAYLAYLTMGSLPQSISPYDSGR